ncbi:GPI mannosyltransferase 4 [Fusarium sp. NRRL 52700]|nr:GPI mannosyltransferase 4 [Fusarium sp. NRRL 52700]
MWRRTYLTLVLIRLWFALSPSYLHPDENFQGPEVIAGQIFSYPVRHTWEFTSENPIRSVFPLWPVYGLPMLLLRWLWIGNGKDGEIPPIAVFWTLRVLMFVISFVLEDWALHELIPSPKHRRVAVLLVASSYVTWTYQTHTFSNSVETLVVAWSLVLIQRVADPRVRYLHTITTGKDYQLTPNSTHSSGHAPTSLVYLTLAAALTTVIAIGLDTAFYLPGPITWTDLIHKPVITPLNNFKYNSATENLAQHGLHPCFVDNQTQNINPTMVGSVWVGGTIGVSTSGGEILAPDVWIGFNLVLGSLMGIYHQGGVVPGQVFLSQQPDATQAIWWKTYTPPIWLLNGKNEFLTTRDVMGLKGEMLLEQLYELATCDTPADRRNQEYLKEKNGTYLIAPASAAWLDPYLSNKGLEGLRFREVWRYRKHLNLDDMDFGDHGVWNTLARVIGRRGLVAWRVTKSCPN